MGGLHCDSGGRSEDFDENAPNLRQHSPDEHLPSPTANLFSPTRQHYEHKARLLHRPPASIPVIPLVFMSILVPVYEFVFVPVTRRITGNPTGITHLQRVGVGLVLSIASMFTAALVELKRRNAFNSRFERINLFWLAFQFGIFGIADLFTFVGLAEFFYIEAAVGMRSLSTSFSYLTLSLGFFLSSVLVQIVEMVTAKQKEDGEGWLYGVDLNSNRLDLFYWFLAILNCVNFGVYVVCAKWYKYRVIEMAVVTDQT